MRLIADIGGDYVNTLGNKAGPAAAVQQEKLNPEPAASGETAALIVPVPPMKRALMATSK